MAIQALRPPATVRAGTGMVARGVRAPRGAAPRRREQLRCPPRVAVRAGEGKETQCCEAEAPAMVGSTDGFSLIDKADPRTAVLAASKTAAVVVEEQGRPLAEYMALPASQYSVLDAKRIERLDADTFRCYVGGINLLGFKVDPVITVSVTVADRGCIVRLLSCRLEGNSLVEAANSRFNAAMTNQLEWRVAQDGSGVKEIVSNMALEVVLTVPAWFLVMSPATVSSTGSAVMQQVVNQLVPRFLAQLQTDYTLWATGDDSRKPLGEGTLGLED